MANFLHADPYSNPKRHSWTSSRMSGESWRDSSLSQSQSISNELIDDLLNSAVSKATSMTLESSASLVDPSLDPEMQQRKLEAREVKRKSFTASIHSLAKGFPAPPSSRSPSIPSPSWSAHSAPSELPYTASDTNTSNIREPSGYWALNLSALENDNSTISPPPAVPLAPSKPLNLRALRGLPPVNIDTQIAHPPRITSPISPVPAAYIPSALYNRPESGMQVDVPPNTPATDRGPSRASDRVPSRNSFAAGALLPPPLPENRNSLLSVSHLEPSNIITPSTATSRWSINVDGTFTDALGTMELDEVEDTADLEASVERAEISSLGDGRRTPSIASLIPAALMRSRPLPSPQAVEEPVHVESRQNQRERTPEELRNSFNALNQRLFSDAKSNHSKSSTSPSEADRANTPSTLSIRKPESPQPSPGTLSFNSNDKPAHAIFGQAAIAVPATVRPLSLGITAPPSDGKRKTWFNFFSNINSSKESVNNAADLSRATPPNVQRRKMSNRAISPLNNDSPLTSRFSVHSLDDDFRPRSPRSSIFTRASHAQRSRSQPKGSSKSRTHPYHFNADEVVPPLPFQDPNQLMAGETPSRRYKKKYVQHERELPLKDLIKRASVVATMLETGRRFSGSYLGHDSRNRSGTLATISTRWSLPTSSMRGNEGSYSALGDETEISSRRRVRRRHPNHFGTIDEDKETHFQPEKKKSQWDDSLPRIHKSRWRKSLKFVIPIAIVAFLLAIAIPLAFHIGSKQGSKDPDQAKLPKCDGSLCRNGGTLSSDCTCNCVGAWQGTFCQLDATCACPDGSKNCKTPIAQALLDTATYAGNYFNPPIDTKSFAAFLSTSSHPTCESQTELIDVSSIPLSTYPTRAAWSSAAILWDIAMSGNTSSELKDFANSVSYWQNNGSSMSSEKVVHGWLFDLAHLTVSPVAKKWTEVAKPSSAQQSQVQDAGSPISDALDRMSSFAMSASAQRSGYLADYWSKTLKRSPQSLAQFRNSVIASPVLVPFDATASIGSQSMLSLTSDPSFPPSIACYPSLSSNATSQIDMVEHEMFGMDAPPSSKSLDPDCSTTRPVYGILNIARTRLPFFGDDPRGNLAQQAIVLTEDAKSRMTVHAGELLAGLPTNLSTQHVASHVSPSDFGLLNPQAIDSVLYNYFQLINNVSTSNFLVDFVLSNSTTPPSSSTPLYPILSSLPLLEVALFGGLKSTDIDQIVSGLSASSTQLVFGSSIGNQLREWAFGISKEIAWSFEARSWGVTVDSSTRNSAFNRIWNRAARQTSASSVYNDLKDARLVK